MASDFKVNGITPSFGNIKLGTNNVSKIYQGSTKVWPRLSQSYQATDLPGMGTYNMLNLEMAEGLWFAQNAPNLASNPTYTSVTTSSITTPTTLGSNTTNDACAGAGVTYQGQQYGTAQQGSQSQGAFVLMIDMTISAGHSSQGMAGGIIVQRRNDALSSWVDATNMSGIQMTSGTNHGYQIRSSSQPFGLYKDATCPTVTGGSGGCGSLCIETFDAQSINMTRYFAFEETGDYRIIIGSWLSAGGSCFTSADNTDYTVFVTLESLYDGVQPIVGTPYHVSSSSNLNTTVNAYAAEFFPGAVKQFFSDVNLSTPLTTIQGAQYFKPINTAGVVNSIINFERSKNGEYTAGFDAQGIRNTNITPHYN